MILCAAISRNFRQRAWFGIDLDPLISGSCNLSNASAMIATVGGFPAMRPRIASVIPLLALPAACFADLEASVLVIPGMSLPATLRARAATQRPVNLQLFRLSVFARCGARSCACDMHAPSRTRERPCRFTATCHLLSRTFGTSMHGAMTRKLYDGLVSTRFAVSVLNEPAANVPSEGDGCDGYAIFAGPP